MTNKEKLYFAKTAVEVEHKKRKTKPIHSLSNRLVFGDELDPPTAESFKNWQRIGNYMRAARPQSLDTAKVFSGPISSSKFVDQIERHKHWDTALEKIQGDRDLTAMAYAMTPSEYFEQMPASYHPHANSVMLNEDSPGALIHELGHGIDLGQRSKDETFRRWLRWNFKPTLLSEYHAWKKGRKAYQEGFAASPEVEDEKALKEYQKNMESYNNRKYPAYGTYLGGSVGGLGGLVGGAVLGHHLSDGSPRGSVYGGMLGSVLGGLAGIYGGALAGKGWAGLRRGANKEKAMKQLEKARTNPKLQEIRDRLAKITSKKKKKKSKKK